MNKIKIKDCKPALMDSSTVGTNADQGGNILENDVKRILARAVHSALGNTVSYDIAWFAGWSGIAACLLEQLHHMVRVNENFCLILNSIFAFNPLVQLTMWVNYITERYLWRPLLAIRVYVAGLDVSERLAVSFLKAIKIFVIAEIAMRMPTTAALSEFDLSKIGPSVYAQLAQGTVIACFAVVLTRAIHQQPIDSLADGPLSSLSSLRWLWMNRGSKPHDRPEVVAVKFIEGVDPNVTIRKRFLAAIPGIAITLSSFVAYLLLSVDDYHQRNWAISVTISGIASELSRLVAAWLAITAMKTRPHFGKSTIDHIYWIPRIQNAVEMRPFIHWRPYSVLRGLHSFSEFTDTSKAIPLMIEGLFYFTWYWQNYNAAIASLSLFCVAVSLAIFSTGALIASGDTSIAAASLGILLCLSACGSFRTASPYETGVLEYIEHSSATRLVEVIVGAVSKTLDINNVLDVEVRFFIHRSLMTTMDFTTREDSNHQAFKIGPASTIDMHDIFYKCTDVYPALKRIMNRKDETTGRCIMLEIADSLYCRALLLIRHAHACTHGNYKLKGSKCNVDALKLMSSILLVSGHVECPEVHEILNHVKAWMDHEDLLWSIIGSHVTLDMMLLPYLRRQLESSNTLDLALRICHMAMYENAPSGNMLEAVPTALYYLLTGNTALGHATAGVVEYAIYSFGTIDMTLALDQVVVRLDEYKIDCQGKLHDWPGGFIPIVDASVNTNQPIYYALAKATFAP
jgi:hypothetical protein